MMDMYIGLASVRIASQHEQIIHACITQSIDCTDDDLQDLLGFKILKILNRFNMQRPKIPGKLITYFFFGNLF